MKWIRSTAGQVCKLSQLQVGRSQVGRAFATASTSRPSPQNNRVNIVEVGPRDGLQNEKKTIPLNTKLELIARLAQTGVSMIEAGSFVSPQWVPQMAHSGDVLEYILRNPIETEVPMTYSFLTPNIKGLGNAAKVLEKFPGTFATQLEPLEPASDQKASSKPTIEVAVFAAATETFSKKNLNCSVQESLEKFKDVIRESKALGMRIRAYISVVLGCPFEGPEVDPHRVAEIATELLEAGADEVSLGDTTGMGTGLRTNALLKCMTAAGIRNEDIAMHFHNTYGQALVNTAVSLEHGIRTFDSSVAGLGGCPYSPGATGNVATEDMVYFMKTLGMDTGIDLDGMVDVGVWIAGELGKSNDSAVGRAMWGARSKFKGPDFEKA